jgi:hypothetical protein
LPLHDCKFVPAQARHRIIGSYHPLQPFRDRAKQRVADRMAKRIVDALEPIEIEKHHRDAIAPAKRLFHLILEQHAIGQIGQRVVPRHMDDLGLGLAAFGDIFVGRDPAAIRGRAIQTGDDAAVIELVKMRLGRALSQELGLLGQELLDVLAGMIMDADADSQDVNGAVMTRLPHVVSRPTS